MHMKYKVWDARFVQYMVYSRPMDSAFHPGRLQKDKQILEISTERL